jgi:hypothetical protein
MVQAQFQKHGHRNALVLVIAVTSNRDNKSQAYLCSKVSTSTRTARFMVNLVAYFQNNANCHADLSKSVLVIGPIRAQTSLIEFP